MNTIFCNSKKTNIFNFFSVLIFIFCLVSCSPIALVSSDLQSIDPTLIQKEDFNNSNTDLTSTIKKELVLAITDLILTDDTDLGRPFSELYLTSASGDTVQSTSYLSIEEFMYNHNKNHFYISLKKDSSDPTVDICLVSGHIDINNILQIQNSKKCKSFPTADLLAITNRGYDFTLENRSEKTPEVKLILHPKHG